MAKDYLAMYLQVTFDLAEASSIVAIRHFSAHTSRLSDAVKSGNLFTDMEDVRIEARQAVAQKQVTVLLDSTLPGRKQILPPDAEANLKTIMSKLDDRVTSSQTGPRGFAGPKISSISIRSGLRNMSLPRPYKQGFVDNRTFTSGVFDMSTSGGAHFTKIPPVQINGDMYHAVTFHNWGQMMLTTW